MLNLKDKMLSGELEVELTPQGTLAENVVLLKQEFQHSLLQQVTEQK